MMNQLVMAITNQIIKKEAIMLVNDDFFIASQCAAVKKAYAEADKFKEEVKQKAHEISEKYWKPIEEYAKNTWTSHVLIRDTENENQVNLRTSDGVLYSGNNVLAVIANNPELKSLCEEKTRNISREVTIINEDIEHFKNEYTKVQEEALEKIRSRLFDLGKIQDLKKDFIYLDTEQGIIYKIIHPINTENADGPKPTQ